MQADAAPGPLRPFMGAAVLLRAAPTPARDAAREDPPHLGRCVVTIYNVLAGVVALVAAEDGDAAIQKVQHALKRAGFYVYTNGVNIPDAFESEDQAVAETLPGGAS